MAGIGPDTALPTDPPGNPQDSRDVSSPSACNLIPDAAGTRHAIVQSQPALRVRA